MEREITYLLVTIHGDHTEKERVVDYLLDGEMDGKIPDDCATRTFNSIAEIVKTSGELAKNEENYLGGN